MFQTIYVVVTINIIGGHSEQRRQKISQAGYHFPADYIFCTSVRSAILVSLMICVCFNEPYYTIVATFTVVIEKVMFYFKLEV